MSRILLLSLLGICMSLQYVTAQLATYHPIFTPQTHWDLSVTDYTTGNVISASQATIKDTTMNAKQYVVFAEDSQLANRHVLIQEDAVAQKVFIVDTDGAAKVLYDFNLIKGDLFEIDNLQFKVVSIDMIPTGEGQRKRIELKCTSRLADQLVWIEGIGSTISPMYHKHYANGIRDVRVSCFFRKGNLVYSLSDYPCSLPLGVNDVNPSGLELKVLPNPFQDELSFKIKNPAQEDIVLRMFAIPGQLIYEEKLEERTEFVDIHMGLRGITAGMYMVEIRTSTSVMYQKVIKE